MATAPEALVCLDFDGTIVDSSDPDPVPAELLSYLSVLADRRIVWIIGTGRTLFQAMEGIANHGLGSGPDYLITSEREIYWRGRLNRWKSAGDWNSECRKAHHKLYRSASRTLKKIKDYVSNETGARFIETKQEPAGIIATGEDEMHAICQFIADILPAACDLGYERNSIYLRFSHSSYSKGTALEELGRQLGLAPDKIFAAGDNYNDLSMLDGRFAKMVACPANAIKEVKTTVRGQGGIIAQEKAGAGTLSALRHYFGE